MDGVESDYMSLDGPIKPDLEKQNAELKAQLASLRNVQMASFNQIERLSLEKKTLIQREQKRLQDLSKVNGSTLRNTDMTNHID
ncbi:hypothetical protein MRB53_041220 [Persea americana]|nr:hypothetical protein MRB53_041220 [Persea americana]